VISFRLKLVVYFLLLALLPLMAAFIGFSAVAQRSESRLADARLQAALRASISAYDQELDDAERRAAALARRPALQRALAQRDRARLRALIRPTPFLRVEADGGFRVGSVLRPAAERQVVVVGPPSGELGVVIASVPLDADLLGRVQTRSGLEDGEYVVFLRANRIVAGTVGRGVALALPEGRTESVSVGGERFRALSALDSRGEPAVELAVLSPQSRIDAANRSTQRRLLLGLAASLLLVLIVAYLEGRSIVRSIQELVVAARAVASGRLRERVPVRGRDEFALLARTFNEMAEQLEGRLDELDSERRRLREATVRFGDALAATHDVDQLLAVVVETVVESTGATGGLLRGRKGELIQAGDPDADSERLELPIEAGGESFGTIVLSGPAFGTQDIETATLLVGQAQVALENARLHGIVERQALVDGLTGLANRRQAEEALNSELSRAQRFGGPLALVLADLDDFKAVNDRYGHPAGDLVLQQFAELLRVSVRDIDVAARWGGEEFTLLLPGTDAAGAAHVAERIRRAFAERTILTPDGSAIRITASFGVAAYPAANTEAALIAAADTALYDAKRAGKDTVVMASEPARSPQVD
jgi:diguanylate cyclase (GGDEF)-like protein